MVNIGDTVAVTVRTWEPTLELARNNVSALQNRLQIAGFRVLKIDDSGLSWLGSYGDLLVTVIPIASAYGSAHDIASIVAGAAQAVGYGSVQGFGGQVVGLASGGSPVTPGTQQYVDNLNQPPAPGSPEDNSFSISPMWLIGAFGLVLAVSLIGGRR